ncbi:MAG: hypothetical protein ACXU82_16435 [Caulobacteraceae bacterium]
MTKTFLLAATFAATVLAGAAHAQGAAQVDARTIDDWRKVDLGSGVSIDVPRAVGDSYRPEDKQDAGLMLFRVGAKDAGEMYCGLDKLGFNAPPLGMVRKRAVDFLTNGAPGIFCHGVGAGVREKSLEVTESRQGYPGSRCVASYSDAPGGKPEGDVIQARVVVAQDAVYVLTCTVRDLDQARAETSWQEIWRARITHVEDSLTLP